MKSRLRVGLSTLLMMVISIAQACGPYFPVSYFPNVGGGEGAEIALLSHNTACVVSTNAIEKSFYSYLVTPHLGTELTLIGAHYYPAWTGKAPKSNHISTKQADELDFFAAGKRSNIEPMRLRADWECFVAFRESVCERLEQGEKVVVPTGIPDYAREFYLYKLGHAEWLVFRRDDDPEAFGELLALPAEQRQYRTVWVHFVRLANARAFPNKDRHLAALRQALDAGFADTAALEAFVLRLLSNTCENRYDPLVLTAYCGIDECDKPKFVQRIFSRRHPKTHRRKWIEKLATDPIGVEVAIAYGAGKDLPPSTEMPEHPALGADRQAWIAFNQGEVDLCRKLLTLSPKRSLIRLFLEARLARLDGHYEASGQFLHEWLEEYRRRGERADDSLVGYNIKSLDERYWLKGPADCDYEPTLPRVVAGELGVVLVARRDLEEALYAFQRACNWPDIAFVAERCMTVDELIGFMRGGRIEPRYKSVLGGLLMRRLVRCGRAQEARMWAPPELLPLCDEFCALSAVAYETPTNADVRAIAFFNLSRLVLTRGMELMGTELRPDVAIYNGAYPIDAMPIAEPTLLAEQLTKERENSYWAGWTIPPDRVTKRFHYRLKAVEYARAAVEAAQDEDVRAWSLMLGGVAALSLDDAQAADWFFKRLQLMHHPRATVDRWFALSPGYEWFRREYYNNERHLVPMRVPPRFTLEQLKSLTPTHSSQTLRHFD